MIQDGRSVFYYPRFLLVHTPPLRSHKSVNTVWSHLPQEQHHISTGIKSVRNLNQDGPRLQLVLRTEGRSTTSHLDSALEPLRTGGTTYEDRRILWCQFGWDGNEIIPNLSLLLSRLSTNLISTINAQKLTCLAIPELFIFYKDYSTANDKSLS